MLRHEAVRGQQKSFQIINRQGIESAALCGSADREWTYRQSGQWWERLN